MSGGYGFFNFMRSSTLTQTRWLDQFARLPHSPYLFLAISRYLRNFAADDFARFRAVANRELRLHCFLFCFDLPRLLICPLPRPPQHAPLGRFFFEPNLRTFYDVLIAFRERRVRAIILHLVFFGTRFTDLAVGPTPVVIRAVSAYPHFSFWQTVFCRFCQSSVQLKIPHPKKNQALLMVGLAVCEPLPSGTRRVSLQRAVPKLRRTPGLSGLCR